MTLRVSFWMTTFFFLWMALTSYHVVTATVPVQAPTKTTTTTSRIATTMIPTTINHSNSNNNNNNQQQYFMPTVFGVTKRLPLTIPRGGAVAELTTLADVQAAIIKASAEQKLVVIDFSATWCGPCKIIAPLFAELSDKMPDVVFLKVDVDENPDTAAKYNVSAMPTFIFLKGGEVVDRLMGANPSRLQELIEEHM